jgi:hypothetical protein
VLESGEPPESIAGEPDTPKLAAEGDIQMEYAFISFAAQI